ncbi:2'-5' RNA ligase family protein [Brachybacterium sp. p3-SID1565]|uniref:RNA 2',3'-cyclic phosphodiesterase n=1 Tax=Brachybacterium epidermidis TaxID=2781983 RepID=A0ABR9W146_9MICO|nr:MULTISPECIES: 2'-5' RNA ligase family protein [Brachybacterium]MBE9404165.1 2'-5' RNA ligase family protein [Brachybacterium epidermidis]MCT1385033.1 2'-5' RNA ligase family protein [Brachybacterium sp. p3-SID1565]
MRVFCSIRPSADAAEHLESALESVRARTGRSLRWGDPDQWHLTLAFTPQLPDGAVEDTIEQVARVAASHRPMRLSLAGAGLFSGRALWVGVGGEVEPLAALMQEDLLGEQDRERRRAHLTVARVSARAPRPRRHRYRGIPAEPDPTELMLAEVVRALSVYRGPEWLAEELEVVSSRLGAGRSGGPLHEVLATVPLGNS